MRGHVRHPGVPQRRGLKVYIELVGLVSGLGALGISRSWIAKIGLLIEVNSAVGELPEGSLLLYLCSLNRPISLNPFKSQRRPANLAGSLAAQEDKLRQIYISLSLVDRL